MIISGSRDQLEKKAASILARELTKLAREQPRVIVGVVGGSSVGMILKQLAVEEVDWSPVHLFMIDERAVPLDHPESNFGLVSTILNGCMAENQMHPYVHDSDRRERSLAQYRQDFAEHGGRFDIVLLSSGEDGHVASLFPAHETIRDAGSTYIMTDTAPKPPPLRISASHQMLSGAGLGLLLFFGEEKRSAFRLFCDDSVTVDDCPAKLVKQISSHYILTDLGGAHGT